MQLISWNVNGYRAVLKKGLIDILDVLDADVVCFQETKAQPDQIELDPELYPYQYKYSAVRKGYSGTMIATRKEPLNVKYGLGVEELDQEGRLITLEYPDYYIATVYTPNAGSDLKRLDFRARWDEAFRQYLSTLNKPIMICGDFNVARGPLDLWDESDGLGKAGYSETERDGFEKHMEVIEDAFRHLYPERVQYTWWSYFSKARERKRGWRIDYWLVSPALIDRVEDVVIYDDIYGSDHCPIGLEMDLEFV